MRHYDLCIIGSGSGNSLLDERFAGLDVAMVEKGVFGGTCLNVGCIPTKMFVLPADLASSPAEAGRLGVDLRFAGADWPAIRDRIFGRIDPISAAGEKYRAEGTPNLTLYRGEATFTDLMTLDTGTGETITADRFVIAAGSRATVPPIRGLQDAPYYTSDTVMRLPELPQSMIIIGGGYIAAEFAHVFAAFGTAVTVLVRGTAMLRDEDHEISTRFTELMAARVDLRRGTEAQQVERLEGDRVRVTTGEGEVLEADVLLVATGRRPNGDLLKVAGTGVELDGNHRVVVDRHQRTRVPGIFALGDVSTHHQLKHVANHEMRVVRHNLLHPHEMIESDHRFVPHAVFSEPQVASVGLTEQRARESGVDYVAVTQEYGSVAYGWALEDDDHFCKLLADPVSGQLLGGHLIGPQASTLIQPLIQAMSFGLGAREMATGQYWIHPALPEVIENALLALPLH
ncbi:MAG: mycothione reductase [Propionibacteriaceae bacterium]